MASSADPSPPSLPAAAVSWTVPVSGMSCAACARRLERVLAEDARVLEARASLAAEAVSVRAREGYGREDMLRAIAAAGYRGEVAPKASPRGEALRLWLLGLLALPFLAAMAAMPFGHHALLPGWLQLALAVPAQAVGGAPFLLAAWRGLRRGSAGMDLLVALGTLTAFGLSLWLLLAGRPASELYFEAGVLVLAVVSLGKALERRALRRAGAATADLLALLPPEAVRLAEDGGEVPTAPAFLRPGERVRVRPGGRVPADGRVVAGRAALDLAALTGEGAPVLAEPGMEVFAGALVREGALDVEVIAAGPATRLGRMSALVAEAQASRGSARQLADRVSAVAVPVVLALAAATFFGWVLAGAGWEHALVVAVSVLVVACPCALGLATPAAVMAAVSAGARAGILVRDAGALERAAEVKAIAFDKTGTLTEGRFRLAALHLSSGVDAAWAEAAAARLQAGSEHPIAQALARPGQALAPGFESLPGRGVSGEIEGRRLWLGSTRLLAEIGAAPEGLLAAAERQAAAGRTLTWLMEERRALALFALEDAPRAGAAEAVAALRRQGLRVRILSGDSAAAVRTLAGRLGVPLEDAEGGLLPEEKQARLAEVPGTAMVGDGMNDAPALAASALGIAMGGLAAVEGAAHVVLVRPNPTLVPAVLALGRATRRTVQANLAWAFGFNALCLPAAATGLLTPAMAGAAMAASSLAVVLASAHLGRWSP